MNLGAAALSVLHSDSSSDDEETGPLAVKNEPVESEASEGLAALAEEAASDNKIEADVGLTSEYKLPEDFFSKVIAKVHYKQRSKLSKESTELRSLATVKYIEYMERNLRVRSKVSKEESGIQVAADSISKTLKRVKIEQLDQ